MLAESRSSSTSPLSRMLRWQTRRTRCTQSRWKQTDAEHICNDGFVHRLGDANRDDGTDFESTERRAVRSWCRVDLEIPTSIAILVKTRRMNENTQTYGNELETHLLMVRYQSPSWETLRLPPQSRETHQRLAWYKYRTWSSKLLT